MQNGVNGFLVKPKDPTSLASALEILISDGKLRRKMGEEGRKIVEDRFGEETVIEQTLEVYEGLLF